MTRPTLLRLALLALLAAPPGEAAAGVCPPLPADMRAAVAHRAGGRLVTLVGRVPAELCADGRIRCPAAGPWDVPQGLAYVQPLIEGGRLTVNIDRVYPLAEIRAAQQHNRDGHTRGKVVVAMAPDAASAL